MIDDSDINLEDQLFSEEFTMHIGAWFNPTFYEIVTKLQEYFQDNDKVHAWLYTKNPMLGNTRPITLVMLEKQDKLLKFIDNSLEGNLP